MREDGRHVAPTPPLTGDPLLEAVTEAMIALHERHHHRRPVSGKTTLLGDELLVCILSGVYTDVEKTMIEVQRSVAVQETRGAFQSAMRHKFIDVVETLAGRTVVSFDSNTHVGPDLEMELFTLRPAGHPDVTTT